MIRTDTKDFPFSDRTDFIWYFLINFKNKKIKDFYNVSGKVELLEILKKIIDNKEEKYFNLFGIWPGQWRTDVFKINLNEAYKELSKHFKH